MNNLFHLRALRQETESKKQHPPAAANTISSKLDNSLRGGK